MRSSFNKVVAEWFYVPVYRVPFAKNTQNGAFVYSVEHMWDDFYLDLSTHNELVVCVFDREKELNIKYCLL